MDGETHGDEAAKVELAEGQEDARSAEVADALRSEIEAVEGAAAGRARGVLSSGSLGARERQGRACSRRTRGRRGRAQGGGALALLGPPAPAGITGLSNAGAAVCVDDKLNIVARPN